MRLLLLLLAVAVVAASTVPWSPSVCGGSLLTDSAEPGCSVNQCHCMAYVAQCDDSYQCMPGITSLCLGRCRLSLLGQLLNIAGTCLIFGCPVLVFIYHVQSFKSANETLDTDHHDVDDADNQLVDQIQHEHLLERVLLHTTHAHDLLENVRNAGAHVYNAGGSAVAALIRAQAQMGLFTVPPQTAAETDVDYATGDEPSPARRSSIGLSPGTPLPPRGKVANSIESYIDVTQLTLQARTHRAVVINVHPQIYLETMPKHVLRLLLCLAGLLVLINIIIVLAQAHFIPFSVQLARNDTNNSALCSSLDKTPCPDATWQSPTVGSHVIEVYHPSLPKTPDVFRLSVRLANATARRLGAGVHRLGRYTLSVTATDDLVTDYSNELLTTCDAEHCADIPLVGVFMKKYGASLFDARRQRYRISLSIAETALLGSFELHLEAMLNGYETAGLATKAILGFGTLGLLGHYLYCLRRHHNRMHPSGAQLSLGHWLVMHLSLERKLFALILVALGVQTNPISVLATLPWLGAVPNMYIVFRSVWETVVYTLALGALLTIIDSYRKTNPRSFRNGAAIAFLGARFIIVKSVLVLLVLGARLALVILTSAHFGATTNIDLVVATADTGLCVFGVALLVSVCFNVSAHLQKKRYSETRYQSLAFRFMSMIAYALLALLLINVVFFSAYAVVSAYKPTFVRQTSVMTECTFTGLMYIAVVAFYPPTRYASTTGDVPRGYVIREKRQFIHTPQELSPTTPTPTTPTTATSSASMFTKSGKGSSGRGLPRADAFRCKPLSTPHHIFCLETACRLFNASRLAYYKSTLSLRDEAGDENPLEHLHPSAYCNQEALARDGMHEVAYLHDVGSDTHCLVLQGDAKIVFAFRGTASKTNVKTDLEIALDPHPWPGDDGAKPGYVHRGFVHAYNSIRDRVHATLRSLCSEYRLQGLAPEHHVQVYTTGHSLGGALATIAALDLRTHFHARVIMYNYGSPRVGCHRFAQSFNRAVPLAFRVVNEGDIICGLPQSLQPECWSRRKKLYKHVGTEVVLDGRMNGDFLIRPTFAEKNLIVDVRRKPARHMLKNYKRNFDVILASVLRDEATGDVHLQSALEKALYGAFGSGNVDEDITIDVGDRAWFATSPRSTHTSFTRAPMA
ncbi:hypothetical protein SPRG_08473 [Saprolegnia parasitica CBS 223.65]|uniref:Fungal lipase-type domain-containing protein n=1 Tax=Saprolegnia parasitica (strain CBS 223.65) TaxID=695850 RepID=A0A067CH28_SAPPC|nr:hypothetical protein SPRG_08473 [Saprolegnia parasitica CBS 223.65]KDO26112.1 hypothetical protein SPRG_08473 [Saprolegnia parasitica CBS 223.65]|eukprot:XP_012203108.1 hypothetical protein SPRG_08473 [Saprolegnia parasitica CBS 223.65]